MANGVIMVEEQSGEVVANGVMVEEQSGYHRRGGSTGAWLEKVGHFENLLGTIDFFTSKRYNLTP